MGKRVHLHVIYDAFQTDYGKRIYGSPFIIRGQTPTREQRLAMKIWDAQGKLGLRDISHLRDPREIADVFFLFAAGQPELMAERVRQTVDLLSRLRERPAHLFGVIQGVCGAVCIATLKFEQYLELRSSWLSALADFLVVVTGNPVFFNSVTEKQLVVATIMPGFTRNLFEEMIAQVQGALTALACREPYVSAECFRRVAAAAADACSAVESKNEAGNYNWRWLRMLAEAMLPGPRETKRMKCVFRALSEE